MEAIYDAGARGSFDVATLHPYTGKPKNVIRIVKIVRRVMERHRDPKLPVWVTELSWPAGPGQDRPARRLRDDRVRPVAPARGRIAAARRAAAGAADRARVLVHVALGRGLLRQRVRLLGAAPRAQRPVARRARADDVPAPGQASAGMHEARRRRAPLRLRSFLARAGRRGLSRGPGRAADSSPAVRVAVRAGRVLDAAARAGALRGGRDGLDGDGGRAGRGVCGHQRAGARARPRRGPPRAAGAGRLRAGLRRGGAGAGGSDRARRAPRRARAPGRAGRAVRAAARAVHALRVGARAARARAAPPARLRARLRGRGGGADRLAAGGRGW